MFHGIKAADGPSKKPSVTVSDRQSPRGPIRPTWPCVARRSPTRGNGCDLHSGCFRDRLAAIVHVPGREFGYLHCLDECMGRVARVVRPADVDLHSVRVSME